MTSPAVAVHELRRTFRVRTGTFPRRRWRDVHAVRGIDLDIAPGSLFGLLGPNGAGKTTTVRMLTTLLLPTSGEVRIHGIDVVGRPWEVRPRIGYALGGDRGFYDRLSAGDNLRFFADLYRVPIRAQRRRVAEVLDLVGLADRRADRVETFSRGMRQRLHIARGLLHDPDVLFLDEPTNGLDPVAARGVRDAIRHLRDAGKTVLLTTHQMYEAEELCDRLAVIADGRLLVEGTATELAARAQAGMVARLETRGADAAACAELMRFPGIVDATLNPVGDWDILTLRMSVDSSEKAEYLARQALEPMTGVDVLHLSVRGPTLEDSYVTLVSQHRVEETC
jgi:ABC-2 type transport system ATP-binding protein